MDNWENIKEALKLTGGKYILAEKGEPSYVIVELDDYVRILKQSKTVNSKRGRNNPAGGSEIENSKRGLIEKVNSNVDVWKNLQNKRVLRKMEVENAAGRERGGGNLNSKLESEDTKIVIEEI